MSRFFLGLLGAIFAICIAPVLVQPVNNHTAERSRAEVMSTRIAGAMHKFRKEFGYWPAGTQAEIVRILRGANDKSLVFLDVPDEKLNENGEITDPWGTPYRILTDAKTQRTRLHSAGPDGVFASPAVRSDDYISHWNAGTTDISGLPF